MTSPVPDVSEDCPDSGTSILAQIDNFLDKIQPLLDELTNLKGNLKSSSSSQSKTLVKQVRKMDTKQIIIRRRKVLKL